MQCRATLTGVPSLALRALAIGVLAASAAACSHWPWHHQPPPPPKPVQVLDVSGTGASVDRLILAAVDADERSVRVEVRSREAAAPHAAAVEAEHPGSLHEPERRPVAEDDPHVAARALRVLEPRTQR
jgi:hypothetical protein